MLQYKSLEKRLWKILFSFSSVFLVLLVLSFSSVFLFGPSLKISLGKYKLLSNWDLNQHATGDFDSDGKEDLISFTGCAFLSKADVTLISPGEQCLASGISEWIFEQKRIGQKYTSTKEDDFNLGIQEPFHSYMLKNSKGIWEIHVNEGGKLSKFEIQQNGLLKPSSNISILDLVNEGLYMLSLVSALVLMAILYPYGGVATPVVAIGLTLLIWILSLARLLVLKRTII